MLKKAWTKHDTCNEALRSGGSSDIFGPGDHRSPEILEEGSIEKKIDFFHQKIPKKGSKKTLFLVVFLSGSMDSNYEYYKTNTFTSGEPKNEAIMRHHKRNMGSPKYKDWSNGTLEAALQMINNRASIEEVSKAYKISRATLSRRVREKSKSQRAAPRAEVRQGCILCMLKPMHRQSAIDRCIGHS
uniref:HTH psq-type domain-containing protein n=1 Tax=Romanomermis culicivorax TaxID=13658 RepID=A0A915JCZ2_ROMCU